MTDERNSRGAGGPPIAVIAVLALAALTLVIVVFAAFSQQRTASETASGVPSIGSLVPSVEPSSGPTPLSAASAPASDAPTAGTWDVAMIQPFSEEDRPRLTYRGLLWFDDLGWVAHGIDRDGHAGIWVSGDGRNWTRANSPAPAANQGYDIVDIARSDADAGPRYVAVGNNVVRSSDGYWNWGSGSVVLVSDDAHEWSRASNLPGTTTWLSAVASDQDGFVAVGTDTPFPQTPELVDGRIWSSPDGLIWTERAPPELVDSLMLGIESIGDTVVAYGFPLSQQGGTPMVAWTSTDRMTWTRSEIRAGTRGTGGIQAHGDADGGQLLVAGNLDGPFVASSGDGSSWTADALAPESAFPFGLDVRDGAAVLMAVIPTVDSPVPSPSPMWVRDEVAGPWREVDWRSQVLEGVLSAGNLFPVDAAIGAERTAILLGEGMVILSSGRLP
jgi:hypothetical protein